MVSNIAASMPTVSQQPVSQSSGSNSSSDSYRDMMDKVVQSDKGTDGIPDRNQAKSETNTVREEAPEKSDDQVKKEAAEKAVSENPVALFFSMQMDATAEQINELNGIPASAGAEAVAAVTDTAAGEVAIQDGLTDAVQGQVAETLPAQMQNAQDVLAQGAAVETVQKPEEPVIQAAVPEQKPESKPVEAAVLNADDTKAENAVMARDAGLSKPTNQKRDDASSEEGEQGAQEGMREGTQHAGLMREPVYDNVEINTTTQPVTAQQTQATPAEEIMNQIPKDLADKIALGQREFTVQLEPENLGKLVIKASFEDGRAMVSIFCTNEKTLELLSTHARELGSIMESNMGAPTNIVLDKSENNYLEQQRNDDQAGQQARQEQEEQERRHQEQNRSKHETLDFLSQLRLGLV